MTPSQFLRYCDIFGIRRNQTVIAETVKTTAEGGLTIRFTNKTGAPSVKGTVVGPTSGTDLAVQKIIKDTPDPIGVIYESGVADGSPVWVVVSGIAEVLFWNNPTRKQLARGSIGTEAGYEAGKAISEAVPTSPFATDKHFYEIGHVLETKGAPGLAKVILHFN